MKESGILYLVPTPIGNLCDMTYRAVEVLKEVSMIAAEDTRTSLKLLNHYGIRNRLVSYHKFNERKQTAGLIEKLQAGENIAIITDAGTPGISDPAQIVVQEAVSRGIIVSCLPGATALIPALAASGLDTASFTFAGFLPAKQKDRQARLEELSALSHTVILYESSHHIKETLSELGYVFGNRQCSVGREISKLYESFYRGGLQDLAESDDIEQKGEFVIVIAGKEKQAWTDEALHEMITDAMQKHGKVADIVAEVVSGTGEHRNRIYKLVLTARKADTHG